MVEGSSSAKDVALPSSVSVPARNVVGNYLFVIAPYFLLHEYFLLLLAVLSILLLVLLDPVYPVFEFSYV